MTNQSCTVGRADGDDCQNLGASEALGQHEAEVIDGRALAELTTPAQFGSCRSSVPIYFGAILTSDLKNLVWGCRKAWP